MSLKLTESQEKSKRTQKTIIKAGLFQFLFYFQVENDIIGSETNPKLAFQSIRYETKSATLF